MCLSEQNFDPDLGGRAKVIGFFPWGPGDTAGSSEENVIWIHS